MSLRKAFPVYTTPLRGWSSQNETLETNFPIFIFMPFLYKYGKLQAFWYAFYFDTWLGKHFLMSSKIFHMKKIEISWFLEISNAIYRKTSQKFRHNSFFARTFQLHIYPGFKCVTFKSREEIHFDWDP
jgi:hypothetical protein